MTDKKIAHLQMIQGVINRMAGNSFLLRGWTVALVAALLALAAKDADPRFILIACFPCLMFWILDGYYLAQERKYRDLYSYVTRKAETDIDFSLNASPYHRPWMKAIFSITNFVFYGTIAITILCVAFAIALFGNCPRQ